ncbi:hypothetical protein GCM10025768_16960 [Microbacterium pseudoresistens]|uniref:LysM domain-containing protein n=1 Tax=Microbacterium pseudoresistens TaxID=640634 RepID=A0A7Y9ESH1_9MICO|nr:LysM peptidoglycan-binding domain-containing protein [Microbacterium pseudoresistens]NYD52951.1 hypothetical protein [Microbacterium pseudoresistens]
MSTVTLAPALRPARSLPSRPALSRPSTTSNTRLRLTARGRRLLAVVVALPLAAGLAFAVLSGGSALASGDSAVGGSSFETVVVMPGDSLWSIAAEVAPTADPRDVIDAMVRLNLLRAGALEVGQELAIPAEYAS